MSQTFVSVHLPEQQSLSVAHACSGALHSPTGRVQTLLAHLPEQHSSLLVHAVATSLQVATDATQMLLLHHPLQQSRWLPQAFPPGEQTAASASAHLEPLQLPVQHSAFAEQSALMGLQSAWGKVQVPLPQLPEQHCQLAEQACEVVMHVSAGAVQMALLHLPEQQSSPVAHSTLRRLALHVPPPSVPPSPASSASTVPASRSSLFVPGVLGFSGGVEVPPPSMSEDPSVSAASSEHPIAVAPAQMIERPANITPSLQVVFIAIVCGPSPSSSSIAPGGRDRRGRV
jgi:hypothetical protein